MRTKKTILALMTLVSIVLASCGGGGDSGSETQLPSIMNLQLNPTGAQEATGVVKIHGSINYTDAGGDIQELYLTAIHIQETAGYSFPSGNWGYPLDCPNWPAAGVTSGVIDFYFDFNFRAFFYDVGVWKIQVWIVDSKGDRSNILNADFNVYY